MNSKYWSLAVIAVWYFVLRTPLLSSHLFDEEGIFADVVVNQPARPDYCLVGHIRGETLRMKIEHPAPMYELMKLAGQLAAPLTHPPSPERRITIVLRVLFSMFQLMFWLLLGCELVARAAGRTLRPITQAMLATLMMMPIAIFSSVELQTDGSAGVFMNGLCMLAIGAMDRDATLSRARRLLLVGGAALLGGGKQEWSLVFVASLLAWGGYLLLLRRLGEEVKAELMTLGLLALGLGAGNLASYLFDPVNYLGGLDVLRRISRNDVVSSGTLPTWRRLWLQRIEWIAPLFVMLAAVAVLLLRQFRSRRYLILIALHGSGLLAGFLMSTWSGVLRYFAPAFVSLAAALVILSDVPAPRWSGRVLAAALAVMWLHGGYQLYKMRPAHPALQMPPQAACIPHWTTSALWNHPEINFINDEIGVVDASKVAADRGARLCR